MFAGVGGVWHAESKLEIKRLQEVVLEVMSLNHPEIAHGFIAHRKLHATRPHEYEREGAVGW